MTPGDKVFWLKTEGGGSGDGKRLNRKLAVLSDVLGATDRSVWLIPRGGFMDPSARRVRRENVVPTTTQYGKELLAEWVGRQLCGEVMYGIYHNLKRRDGTPVPIQNCVLSDRGTPHPDNLGGCP